MHRSGTSFLARALNLHGVFLGDFDSIRNHEWNYHWDNPRGNWENKLLLDLSEKTLELSGGSWDNIPNKIGINKKMGNQINNEIKKLSDNSILASGFKAPQIIFCFDSWFKFFPKNFIVIGIVRNPLKVAESLKTRNNFNYKKSLNLWKIYNQKLYEILEKYNGFLLDFDWPKQKLLKEIELISKKLGLAKNIDISNWYTEDLFRSDKTFKSDYILPDEVQNLYSKLKDRTNNNMRVKIHPINHSTNVLKSTVNNLLSDIQKQNQFFTSLRKELQSQNDFFKSLKNEIQNDPISILMTLYNTRNDLQKSFPEAKIGNLTGLITWAELIIKDRKNEGEATSRELLSKFSNWYSQYLEKIRKDESALQSSTQEFEKKINIQIATIESEKKQFSDQIATLESEKKQFKNEISNKQNDISKLNQEISKQSAENSALIRDYTYFKDELARHQHTLDNIKSGIGFKIIRFYATKIEKIRKIKKREFTISTDPVSTPSSYIESSKISQEKSSSSKSVCSSVFSMEDSR